MAILGRQTLYSIFVNGAIPTEKDYQDLIDSSLNRKDDCFFGKWQAGVTYCNGDVVLYGKSLYMLVIPEGDECEPTDEEETGEETGGGPPRGCICSAEPPDADETGNPWCLLELKIQDDDWELVWDETGETVIGVARVTGSVAIGSDDPQATLDITDQENGQILIEPNQVGHPTITMLNLSEPTGGGKVDYRLEEDRVCWDTDTLGYVFKVMGEEVVSFGNLQARSAAPKQLLSQPEALMLITHTPEGHPSVGIGTGHPGGTLDLRGDGKGRMVVNPHQHNRPEILLVDLEGAGNGHYTLSTITKRVAVLSTNSPDGFLFTKGMHYKEFLNEKTPDAGNPWLSIQEDKKGTVKVGVGTDSPTSSLEVIKKDSGSVRVHLERDNPSLSISNLRPSPDYPDTYIALGVGDDQAVLISDKPFVVKHGGNHGKFENEVNINQGEDLLYISTEGKTGILTNREPTDYHLDVNGKVRSNGVFLGTDEHSITQTGVLGKVLSAVCDNLTAIEYTFKQGTNREGEKGIGFFAQNIFENFPELVEKTDNAKAIDYSGLTAVLVKAIQ